MNSPRRKSRRNHERVVMNCLRGDVKMSAAKIAKVANVTTRMILVLHIAGLRESKAPGTQARVKALL